ncbi:hypothetical protein SAY86_030089 [Trapa natans]|uniref:Uncharacterized protein n=1 Tax=Trapa natans TaxID=22666 RepID=A0AAN7RI11_TRANT|nr:hypothetical protein SAY86_030089 [Trapa natans]
MADRRPEDRGRWKGESSTPAIDPRLLRSFKELYHRNRELFQRLFPKFRGETFAEFSQHFEDMCSEVRRGISCGGKSKTKRDDSVLQRSLSVGSPMVASREIGGDLEPLKIERFKVRTVDIDGPPRSGSGQNGSKAGGGGGGKSK